MRLALLVVCISLFVCVGCGGDGGSEPEKNRAPTVQITSGPSGTIQVNSATFQWSGSDEDGTIECYYYDLDDSSPDRYAASSKKSHTFQNLANGSHVFYVKAEDNDGEDSDVASRSFTVNVPAADTTPPNTAISAGPSGTIDYNDVEFTWTGSDNVTQVGNLVYSYKLQGYNADYSQYSSATSKSYSALANGIYTFYVKAKDEAGNVDATPASRSLTVDVLVPDTTPPTTTILTGPSGTIDYNDVEFTWTGSDNVTSVGNLVYACKLEGYDADYGEYSSATSKSCTDLVNGSYTFHVRARDEAGNVDVTPASRSFTVAAAIQEGQTNDEGNTEFRIGGTEVTVHVTDEYNSPLTGIAVYLADLGEYSRNATLYGSGWYLLMAEDPGEEYYSWLDYLEEADLSEWLNVKLRSGNDLIVLDEVEEYPELSERPLLDFLQTCPASQLYDVYQQYDALIQYASLLEFVASVTNDPLLLIAVKLNEFRDKFIESQTAINEVLDHIASGFGEGFDSDALYYDVYVHRNLGVLTHDINDDDPAWCTIKGSVTKSSDGTPLGGVTVACGSRDTTTTEDGRYTLFFVREGYKQFTASKSGYESESKWKSVELPAEPPYFKSITLDFELEAESPNDPPYKPSEPSPGNNAVDVDISADLRWTGGDPNGDPVTYDVYFGTIFPPPKVSDNQSSTSYDPGTMLFETQYHWKISTSDGQDETVGDPWQFTTKSQGSSGEGIIAFERGDDIWLMNADGSNLQQLTTAGSNWGPSFSPNGEIIAFVRTAPGFHRDIYVMNSNGSGEKQLTTSGNNEWPMWSPSGDQIIFSTERDGNWEIYVMNASDGTNQLPLVVRPGNADFAASWSPVGGKIAFSSGTVSLTDNLRSVKSALQARSAGIASDIWIMNSDGTGLRQLTTDGLSAFPVWSPSGGKIAFESGRNQDDAIYLMNADGSNQTRIGSDAYSYLGNQICWSPDGTRIAFSDWDDGVRRDIYLLNVTTHSRTNITNTTDINEGCPTWTSE